MHEIVKCLSQTSTLKLCSSLFESEEKNGFSAGYPCGWYTGLNFEKLNLQKISLIV